MLALYIIGGILLVLIILLNIPLFASLQYLNRKFDIRVKYLFITLYPKKEKAETPDTKKNFKRSGLASETKSSKASLKAKRKFAKKSDTNAESPPEDTIQERRAVAMEKGNHIFELLKSSRKAFRFFIKGIRIDNIRLDFITANEDAYEAALFYGTLNMLVFNAISALRTFFTISIEKIDISCRYNSSENQYDGKCVIRITPGTLLIVIARIFYHYLVNNYKKKKNKELSERNDQYGTPDSGNNEHSNGEDSRNG